jgi:hypothetical protein
MWSGVRAMVVETPLRILNQTLTTSMSMPSIPETSRPSYAGRSGALAEGKAIKVQGTSADVLRLQGEGHWLFAFDHPFSAS